LDFTAIKAFSELKRSSEGLSKRATSERRGRIAFAVTGRPIRRKQGEIPKRDFPFSFLRCDRESVECRNRIGGQMEDARQRQAVVQKPRGTGARKNAINRGRTRLNAEADKALDELSKEIAFSLLGKTIDGNVTSAKLLVALAEGQFDCEDEGTMRSLLSLAERLAAEPECSGEVIDGTWDDGSAQRAPKLVNRAG